MACAALTTQGLALRPRTGLSIRRSSTAARPRTLQRRAVEQQGRPVQNGMEYDKAGDLLSTENTFLNKTNDPAGFNLVDVIAWGALGHAAAYFILACASNTYSGPSVITPW